MNVFTNDACENRFKAVNTDRDSEFFACVRLTCAPGRFCTFASIYVKRRRVCERKFLFFVNCCEKIVLSLYFLFLLHFRFYYRQPQRITQSFTVCLLLLGGKTYYFFFFFLFSPFIQNWHVFVCFAINPW